MTKLMITTCLALLWAFYEMSGGADFEPRHREIVSAAPWNQPALARQDITVAQLQPASFQIAPTLDGDVAQDHFTFAAAEEVQAVTVEDVAPVDLRIVAGNRVNMRVGPSTDHTVLRTLARGTEAEVIEIDSEGWARITLVETGQVGWIAGRLLTDS